MDDKPDPLMNARPLRESIAGTANGLPDDALKPGEELPAPPTDEEVRKIARKLDVPVSEAKDAAITASRS